MKRKLKILLTSYSPFKQSGGPISTYFIAKGLKNLGHEVYIASTGLYPKDIETIIIPKYKKIPLFWLQKIISKRIFSKIIKDKKIDIIHSQGRLTAPGTVLAAKENNILSAVHFRSVEWLCPNGTCLRRDGSKYKIATYKEIIKNNSGRKLFWNIYKWYTIKSWWKIIKSADIKISISNFIKDKMKTIGIDSSVLYNPREFPVLKFTKEALKKKYGLKKIVFTYIGRLHYPKGIPILLKVMPPILEENKDVSFVIVGKGELKEKIKKLEQKYKNLVLIGEVPFERMGEIYSLSDVVFCPSIVDEALSGVVVESIIHGKPIIGSNTGGTPEILRNDINGYNIDPFDYKTWTLKIKKLIKDKKLRERMGRESKKISSLFKIKRVAEKLEARYNKVR